MTDKQINSRRAKVAKELSEGRFGPYGESEFHKYGFKEFQAFCAGRLIVGIGEGEFKTQVYNVIIYTLSWDSYQKQKQELEKKYHIFNL